MNLIGMPYISNIPHLLNKWLELYLLQEIALDSIGHRPDIVAVLVEGQLLDTRVYSLKT